MHSAGRGLYPAAFWWTERAERMYTDSSKGGPEGARRTAREGMGVSTKREQVESAGRCYQSRAPGEICRYPGFEYCPAGAEETPEETVRRYFASYEALPARRVWLGREPDPALAEQCGSGCRRWDGTGRPPLCCYRFWDGLRAVFDLEGASGEGTEDRSMEICDLRLMGRPVRLKLWWSGRGDAGVRKRLGALTKRIPGARDGDLRCSVRLAEAVDRGLLHGVPPDYLAEASALPEEDIRRWERRRIMEASRALPLAVSRYTLEECGDFSTATEKRSFLVPDSHGVERWEKYTLAFRTEMGKAPRLISLYPAAEWALVRKLVSTPLTRLMDRHRLWISPQRLFNLAVDFLSAPQYGGPEGAPPVFGAMLVLSLWEESEPGCGAEIFRRLDEPYRGYYTACYRALLALYEEEELDPWSRLPQLLRELTGGEDGAIRRWYRTWADRAEEAGVAPARCRPGDSSIWSTSGLELPARLAAEEGAGSMRELITRLLLFNPVTLAACAGAPEGTDYRRVSPGIPLDQLKELLAQGFLTGERTGYLDLPPERANS